uniref:Uncharacterized protein n=1 Tax=Sphaerodactylus townsendi TaxID=933632 RepID=A0ACB8G449_9SAUR
MDSPRPSSPRRNSSRAHISLELAGRHSKPRLPHSIPEPAGGTGKRESSATCRGSSRAAAATALRRLQPARRDRNGATPSPGPKFSRLAAEEPVATIRPDEASALLVFLPCYFALHEARAAATGLSVTSETGHLQERRES